MMEMALHGDNEVKMPGTDTNPHQKNQVDVDPASRRAGMSVDTQCVAL